MSFQEFAEKRVKIHGKREIWPLILSKITKKISFADLWVQIAPLRNGFQL
jgi:hypothetical protein